jgi:hypothetical protein
LTALATDLAGRLRHAFALLRDLERLAPGEHAAIVATIIEELRAMRPRRRRSDARSPVQVEGEQRALATDSSK